MKKPFMIVMMSVAMVMMFVCMTVVMSGMPDVMMCM
jgi:hypothetical protein